MSNFTVATCPFREDFFESLEDGPFGPGQARGQPSLLDSSHKTRPTPEPESRSSFRDRSSKFRWRYSTTTPLHPPSRRHEPLATQPTPPPINCKPPEPGKSRIRRPWDSPMY